MLSDGLLQGGDFLRKDKKVFFKTTGLERRAAALGKGTKTRKDSPARVRVQSRQKEYWGRLAQRFIERSLQWTGHVLRDAFHETLPEEGAAGFDRVRRIQFHGVLLPIVENEKSVGVDDKFPSFNNPCDLSVKYRFDGERPGKIFDAMPSG